MEIHLQEEEEEEKKKEQEFLQIKSLNRFIK
jgi:hypothetical protein